MVRQPDTATVVAARAGDPVAVDRLVAGYLPLVYTIVGRALEGHADVDDVVQEVMIRVLRNLPELREPEAFRSWLVAITVRQVRERFRGRHSLPDAPLDPDLRDPGADFTDLAITRLELAGQRRETAEATRWLDEENRELLSLWWLEASGELTRDEIVEATGVGRQHAAVRIQRMKAQLETARAVVRALHRSPRCPELATLVEPWDGRPGPLWRKRIARHTRECRLCSPAWHNLVAAERLLAGMALVPLPPGLFEINTALGTAVPATTAAKSVAAVATKAGTTVAQKMLVGVLAAGIVTGGGAAVAAYRSPAEPIAPVAVASLAPRPSASRISAVPRPAASRPVPPSRSAVAAPSLSPPVSPSVSRKPAAAAPVTGISAKKGAGVWKFAGSKAALKDVGASWYYGWGPDNDQVPGPAGVEFVPMIWGAANLTSATLSRAKAEGDVLLGFNEPDLAEQSNMSVEDALAAWPKLEATGMKLVSPAVAFGGDTAGGWLDRFMTGAKAKGLTVDAIALHWYGSDFSPAAVNQFLGYVDAVHQRYGKPIWITEFGLMNFGGAPKYPSDAQKVTFINGATAGLEKRSYVERYAWFGLPAVGDSVDFGLYADGNSPTEAGKAYRAAG